MKRVNILWNENPILNGFENIVENVHYKLINTFPFPRFRHYVLQRCERACEVKG